MLLNVMEEVVRDKLLQLLKGYDCCKCDICLEDMMCIALNALPPKYVSTPRGELFSKADSVLVSQMSVDADVSVTRAIQYVSTHVRHEIKE